MDKRGLTLVELVVALGIASVLLAVLTQAFWAMERQQAQVLALHELAENLHFALDEIDADLKRAVWVITAEEGQLALRNESGQRIRYVLKRDSMAERHPYELTGLVLYRSTDGGQNQPVANFIQQLSLEAVREAELITAVTVSLSGEAAGETITVTRTVPVGGLAWRR